MRRAARPAQAKARKEKPSQDCEGFALKEIRSRKRGEHKTSPSRCSCSKYRRFEHSERTWSCAVSRSESSGYSLMHRNSSTPSRPWICSTRTGCRRIACPRILRLPRAEKPCRSSLRGHRPSYRQRYRLSLRRVSPLTGRTSCLIKEIRRIQRI